MASIYESMRDFSKHKITRREFLKRAAAAGMTTPAVIAFLQACAAPGTQPVDVGATPTPEQVDLSNFTQAQAQQDPLVFNSWSFLPEMVTGFQRTFEEQYNEAVNYEIIPGNYTGVLLNKMVADAPLDCMYTTTQAAKFMDAGWLHDLSDLDNIDEIREATLPAQWEAQTYNGQILGLPYFNSAKCCLFYNRVRTEEAGITEADLPTTWDEVYDMCRQLKADGLSDRPIVMWWPPTLTSLDNLVAECQNRGDPLWDENFNAVFDTDTPIAATLDAWQQIWAEELVPPDAAAGGDTQEMFASGDPVFSVAQSYQLKSLNDPEQSAIAGNVMMVPYQGQSWGLLDYGLYSIASGGSATKLERRKRWVEFMGYKDRNGDFLVAKEWVKRASLGTGYPEVYEDPEVVEAYQEWMPEYPKLRDILFENMEHVRAPSGWKAPWFPDWSVPAVDIVANVIHGNMAVTDAVQQLRDEWDTKQAEYVG